MTLDPHDNLVVLVLLLRAVMAARAGGLLPPLGEPSQRHLRALVRLMWQEVQGLLPWGTRLVRKALMDTREGGTSLS